MSATGGQEGEWLRVESFEELHRGCAVRVVDCLWCDGGSHFGTVTSDPVLVNGSTADGCAIKTTAVVTTIFCGDGPAVGICGQDIIERRVFRMRPDAPAASETTTTVPARRPLELCR